MARHAIPASAHDSATKLSLCTLHGVGDLTLRALGKGLEDQCRMLVYHFGSRGRIDAQILSRLRELEDAASRLVPERGEAAHDARVSEWYWKR